MAESMVQAHAATAVEKKDISGAKEPPKPPKGKTNVRPQMGKETKSSKEPEARRTSVNPGTSQANAPPIQKELLSILSEIRNNQKVQETKLLAMETKFDNFEHEYEQYDDESGYYVGETYEETESEIPPSGSVNVAVDDNNNALPSVFKTLGTKFNVQENLDMEVDDELASLTNTVFKEGLSEEKFKTMVADIGRPLNCEGLSKTRVNNVIWNLLSAEMHSADGKMQLIQDCILKATSLVVKLLNLGSDRLARAELEMGTDAIGLLGHANRAINNRRKAMHKKELNQEYHHLCSQSRGYTDMLYGDDVGKDVKEIQDINKIGSKIKSQYSYPSYTPYTRGRGGRGPMRGVYRGRIFKARGRGRGSFRPKNPQGVYNTTK